MGPLHEGRQEDHVLYETMGDVLSNPNSLGDISQKLSKYFKIYQVHRQDVLNGEMAPTM